MGADADADAALRAPLGSLLGEGAEATIHVVDDDRVVRVAKGGRSLAAEADVMRYAAEHGYPVPEVLGVSEDGRRLLLQRVHGPPLLEALLTGEAGPAAAGEMLGELHRRLHALDAPEWLGTAGEGGSLLHLDLHPANVLLAADGPVVIDWPNAAAGAAGLDVADAYLVMASFPAPPGDLARLQTELVDAFRGSCAVADPSPWFEAVLDRRAADPHFGAEMLASMRVVAERG
jgi:tRNA A-37 threonylcarbamoyl transferase component Bud32